MESLRSKIKSLGLKVTDVTNSTNGYPTPFIGTFVHGFSDFQQAKSLADDLNGKVVECRWKSGWTVVNLFGEAFEPIKPQDIQMGDNYRVIDSIKELQDSLSSDLSQLDKDDDADVISQIQESFNALLQECSHVNWESESVILYQGEYFDTVKKESMYSLFDNNHRAIGVLFETN